MVIAEIIAVNACSRSSESFLEGVTKGPVPCSVPQIAIPERNIVTVIASLWPKRRAAQSRKGMQRYSSGYACVPDTKSLPKIVSEVRISANSNAEDARNWSLFH